MTEMATVVMTEMAVAMAMTAVADDRGGDGGNDRDSMLEGMLAYK
jgi:hypothetical protein